MRYRNRVKRLLKVAESRVRPPTGCYHEKWIRYFELSREAGRLDGEPDFPAVFARYGAAVAAAKESADWGDGAGHDATQLFARRNARFPEVRRQLDILRGMARRLWGWGVSA